MRKMTLYEFVEVLTRQLKGIDSAADSALNVASKVTHSFYSSRIFDYGLDMNSQPIGSYSTKKTNFFRWNFLPKNYSKFKPSGYFFENRRKIAYMTLDGYKKLKEIQGLRGDTVNLTYTGELKRDFSRPPVRVSASRSSKKMVVNINNTSASSPGWDVPKIPRARTNVSKLIKLTGRYGPAFIKHSFYEKNMFFGHFNRTFIKFNFEHTPWQLTTADITRI